MSLTMFSALLPYFGCKRNLSAVIFKQIASHIPRERWKDMVFVDAFLGSGAVSLYAKAHGFKIVCNDIAERSYLAGKALVENNDTHIRDEDVQRLFIPNEDDNKHFIERSYVPDIFPRKHAAFLDRAFANANTPLFRYLLVKYIFHIRPYSKFTSPNAFNIPFSEGRFDEIKPTYTKHIRENLSSPLSIAYLQRDKINSGIFSNGKKNEVYKQDVFSFIKNVTGDILYLDPPYAGTLAYEKEYEPIDIILGEGSRPKSRFSSKNGMDELDSLLAEAGHFPYWVISFGNAAGKNDFNKLRKMISKYRTVEAIEFSYTHCAAMATEKHKKQCKEWMIIAGDIIARPKGKAE